MVNEVLEIQDSDYPAVEDDYEEPVQHKLLEMLDDGNIVDRLADMPNVAAEILTDYDDAKNSMADWLEKYKLAIKLAKMQPKEKQKTFPFRGASTAMLPFVLDAMIDFNARSSPELAFSKKIVSAKVYGNNDIQKEARAKRVAEYSNYQLSELIPHWRDEQDKNLLILPCVGTTYKKVYYDQDTGEVCSDLCLADEIIFDHKYKTFDMAPDKYQECSYTKNELITYIRGDQQWDIDESQIDDEEDEEFIEAYTWCDLDDDGLKEPYFIVVWKKNSQCVYMRPLFDEDTLTLNDDDEVIKVEMIEILEQYRFMPDPEGGPMGLGWGIILGPMFNAINTSLRQQLDAGTLMTTATNSGLINLDTTSRRGNSVQSGPVEVKMGQLTPVKTRGNGGLSQNVMQFPFSGPNASMFNMLNYMTDLARNMVNTSSAIEANTNEAAALYLARLQQGLKRPNVIVMRVYQCAKREFNCIFKLNGKHYSDSKYNKVLDDQQEASMQSDFSYDDCDIELVADPSQGSDMERAARATAVLQEAKTQTSQILNQRQAYLDWLDSIQYPQDKIEQIAPEPQGQDPQQQLLLAQQQMDAEFRERDQKLREQGQLLQAAKLDMETQKHAMEAAREMTKMGLQSDLQEAQIVEKYTQSLKNLFEIGMQDPMAQIANIENQFITNDEGVIDGSIIDSSIPASNAGADTALGAEPSDPGVPQVPGLV